MRKGEGGVEVDGQMGKGEEMVVELEVSAPNSVAKIFHWKTRCLRLLPPPVASTPMATTRSVDAFGYHPPLRSAPYHYPLATTPPHHPPGSTIGGGLEYRTFPHHRHGREEFEQKCASLREWITSGNLAGRRHHDISARVFSDSADRIWRDVLLNKELNLTSYYAAESWCIEDVTVLNGP
uniref:Uncharacterized protein n=1 Tax=Oryza sativa subsp. japonica TaxID=39947 RepID=Q33BA7_ORYSJ|nr:hypothetical protein LOC_Os10g03640 [Oryza sativa Japonica Group]